ncbi:MAG: purine phosphorylase [Rhodospirillaceae bacterium]|nr:purine phosphorylase [Rhodospirillaceae bacterium]
MTAATEHPATARSLGIVTGLAKETGCLRRSGAAEMLMVHAAAGRPEEAAAAARAMAAHGASGLVSFGVAGGLDPSLGAGVIVIAASVIGPDGEALPAHQPWVKALMRLDGGYDSGAVVGSDDLVMTALDKRRLFRRYGALAVDMESHAVAAVARDAGIPFAAIRAIGDPAGRSVPRAALAGLMPDGRTRALPVLAGLLRRPHDFAGIWRLARETNRALAALRGAVEAGAIDVLR